jgi:uncharacterized RDD family membrane protein YckC
MLRLPLRSVSVGRQMNRDPLARRAANDSAAVTHTRPSLRATRPVGVLSGAGNRLAHDLGVGAFLVATAQVVVWMANDRVTFHLSGLQGAARKRGHPPDVLRECGPALWVLYFELMTYLTNGRTLGKWLLNIRVVSLAHGRLSLWHSIERALGYGASALEFGFGFAQYFVHPNHRTVHDRIAETIVVADRQVQSRAEASALQEINAQRGEVLPEPGEASIAGKETHRVVQAPSLDTCRLAPLSREPCFRLVRRSTG